MERAASLNADDALEIYDSKDIHGVQLQHGQPLPAGYQQALIAQRQNNLFWRWVINYHSYSLHDQIWLHEQTPALRRNVESVRSG